MKGDIKKLLEVPKSTVSKFKKIAKAERVSVKKCMEKALIDYPNGTPIEETPTHYLNKQK